MAAEGAGRTVVVPESFFEALGIRLMKDFGPNAAESLLYEIGRDAGRAFAKRALRSMDRPFRDDQEIFGLISRFGSEYRWADIRLRELDVPGKFAVVEWRNGIGVPKSGSTAPVCHLGRGLLSGAAEVIFGVACDAIETRCQATGSEACEIVVGDPERVSGLAEQIE